MKKEKEYKEKIYTLKGKVDELTDQLANSVPMSGSLLSPASPGKSNGDNLDARVTNYDDQQ